MALLECLARIFSVMVIACLTCRDEEVNDDDAKQRRNKTNLSSSLKRDFEMQKNNQKNHRMPPHPAQIIAYLSSGCRASRRSG